MSSSVKTSQPVAPLPPWLDLVREKVESLNYGVVQIVVQKRIVTQIERTEKTRLDSVPEVTVRRRENY